MKIKKKKNMLYAFLFLMCCLANTPLQADIASAEFSTMLSFIKNTDLNTASDAEYAQFMAYSERIATDGSPEQQALLETVLEGEDIPEEEITAINTFKKIDLLLESDIITPEVWQKNVMEPLKEIDQQGTAAEKAELGTFIASHKDRIAYHCKKLITSLYYDPHVKEALKFIIVNTILGVLPSLGLKSLSILAGNLPLATATTQLTDLSVLCALDSIVRYGFREQSEYLQAPIAAGISTAVQDFIGFVGPRPMGWNLLGAQVTTTEMAALQAATIVFAKNNVINQNNMLNIVNNLDWKEVAIGSENTLISEQSEKTLIGYLQNALTPVLQNNTVRSIAATTLSYAVEGALLAAALNMVGLGFYGETTTTALVAGMTRGALEGLMLHASHTMGRPGIVQRISTGFGVSSVQHYLTTGIMGTSMSDLVPLVTQQVLAGAVDGVVQKTGGWKKFVTSLFAR
jgi:hypothetical protein